MPTTDSFDEAEHPRENDGRFASSTVKAVAAGVAMAHPLRMQAHALQRQRRANSHDNKVVQLFRGVSVTRGAPKPMPEEHQPAAPQMNGEGRPVFTDRRSLARSTSAWTIGAKTKELPIGYTGSRQPELPVGSYKSVSAQDQRPATMSVEDHQALRHKLRSTIELLREPVVAAAQGPKKGGKLRGKVLIPEGTSKTTINRAYNLASLRALHAFGVMKADYAMDDHLKAELTPMTDFIRYAERRVLTTMLATQKGQWRPYREEFGQPFKDNRRDKVTGEVRLRVPSQGELIKAVLFDGYTGLLDEDELAKADDEPRDNKGRWTKEGQAKAVAIGRVVGAVGGGAALMAGPTIYNLKYGIGTKGARNEAGVTLSAPRVGLPPRPPTAPDEPAA